MIVSSIPGRIRIRHPRLRDRAWAEPACRRLAALPGVEARLNERVGSLLVTYDPARADERSIREALDLPAADGGTTDGGTTGGDSGWRVPGGALELWVLGSLGLTIATGFLRLRSLHVAAGVVLIASAATHVYRSRAGRRERTRSEGARR